MIKKIKITNHSEYVLRDTTVGKMYDVTVHEKGSLDITGDISIHDTLCLIDDHEDSVAFWVKDSCYEVVEEE